MIDDLSYSGLSDLIQGDIDKGKSAIIELSDRYINVRQEISLTLKKLTELKEESDFIYGGLEKTIQHLKLQYPLFLKVERGIITIDAGQITLETNVL